MRASGTPSHVTEPDFTGVSGRYLDLSAVYDCGALHQLFLQFSELTAAYKRGYGRAYSLLRAAHCIRSSCELSLSGKSAGNLDIIAHDAAADFGQAGPVREIFLSAVTGDGYIPAMPQTSLPAEKLIYVKSSCGFENAFMQRTAAAAAAAGSGAVICRSPRAPEQIEHVIFPGSAAFISGAYAAAHSERCTCVLELDPVTGTGDGDPHGLRQKSLQLAQEAENTACAHLSGAKRMHDELEALYRPYVDFDCADRIFRKELEWLTGKIPDTEPGGAFNRL